MTKIIQPLRIYSAIGDQMVYRHNAIDYNLIVPLLSSSTSLPPFCITTAKTGIAHPLITSCKAVRRGVGTQTELITYLDFSFAWDSPTSPTKQYIFHAGESTIPALKYGIYHLVLTDGTNTWYSDHFRVGNYQQTIQVDFTSTDSFSGLWMTASPYKAKYVSYTYDPGTYDEYQESHKDDDAIDVITYNRFNKLRGFFVLGDSNVMDCLKMASVCDTIYLTNELGSRERIKIVSVTPEPVKRSNYIVVSVTYLVYSDDIITVNHDATTNVYDQDGTSVVEVTGGLTFDGEDVYFNGELITP
jgi:hypothetical protein